MIIAINFGVSVTFWTGVSLYVIALIAYMRRAAQAPAPAVA